MKGFLAEGLFLWMIFQQGNTQMSRTEESNCCEGDILILLDSSGSVADYEFAHLLGFLIELLHPFSLGRGSLRVALLQVSTSPHFEFGLDVHNNWADLRDAVRNTRHLKGDTNTVAALSMAHQLLTEEDVGVPRILLWLADTVQPGDVEGPMFELKALGVSVLAVYVGHTNYQLLKRVVTPPITSHLHFVAIDDINIIKENLTNAITAIICAERMNQQLRVAQLTCHAAMLQWHPAVTGDEGYYELRYTSAGSRNGQHHRHILPGNSVQVELNNLQPHTNYRASLYPRSILKQINTLCVTFTTPESKCCEGDILILLDSSGSVADYEFVRLLGFLIELLRPFSLGRGYLRVALLQVSTSPHLEFGLDVHNNWADLRDAVRNTRHLKGDTNTVAALSMAQQLLTEEDVGVPRILLWLADTVQPGDVEGPMFELKALGVSVLAVYVGHTNYQLLKRVVTPPITSHLYFVAIDDINIIKENLTNAIIEITCAEQLRVKHLTSNSVVLEWRPILTAGQGYYELWYTSDGTTNGQHLKSILSGDSTWVEVTDLQPNTTYRAFLHPQSNLELFNILSVTFTIPTDILSPAVVSVSDSGPHQVRVNWAPLQLAQVQRYTVEYSTIPSGPLHSVTLQNHQTSTLLTGLEPSSQYLITVSALYITGKEKAMSVRACTQEVLPALIDLRLRPVEEQGVQVAWQGHQQNLRGYWLSWERETPSSVSKPSISSVYLPPTTVTTQLAHLSPGSRVCVAPVYSSGRGDGICCNAKTNADSHHWVYS
ncbi:von Willebrand factor A domain-containing protein 1-like [Thalassophryne amazonica]|uniref:von Willebrand factor A domain-containing protein 1-like n=1 Tax=Thalassophryne amazonica TaxID=390379 RepID=UPI001470ED65|nr:von Willebrand factor A domain-containing protein 1-like [Thalassophryne amazonica]